MSWGEFAGTVAAEMGGGPWARIAGSGYDLLTAGNKANELAAQQEGFRRKELELRQMETNSFLADRANQLALRDRLLQQSSDIQSTTEQVNQFLGVPYSPSQADIIADTARLSDTYQRDILKLAELNASRDTAKSIYRLGGADSVTVQGDQARANVEKYGDQLNKARLRARVDSIAYAASRMKLDDASRGRLIEHYLGGLPDQFEAEKGLYNKDRIAAPMGAATAYGKYAESAGSFYNQAQSDQAKALQDITKRISTPSSYWGEDVDGLKTAAQSLGESLGFKQRQAPAVS